MKITDVRLGILSVPLRVPFKTALRHVESVEDVICEIETDTGSVGFGEAPPTGTVTGDTTGAIIGASRPEQVKENVGATGVRIPPDLMRRIDETLGDVVERDPGKTWENAPKQRPS